MVREMSKKNIIGLGIFIIVGLLTVGGLYVANTSLDSELKDSKREYANLLNEIDVKEQSILNNELALVNSINNLDSSRVTRDNEIAQEFIEYVTTWGSGAQYDEIRTSVMKDYQLNTTSNFTKHFLTENVKVVGDGGVEYNYIDRFEINSQYEDMTSILKGINSDIYSYLTEVEWSTQDVSGNEATSSIIFMYSVNGNGDLLNLDAYIM